MPFALTLVVALAAADGKDDPIAVINRLARKQMKIAHHRQPDASLRAAPTESTDGMRASPTTDLKLYTRHQKSNGTLVVVRLHDPPPLPSFPRSLAPHRYAILVCDGMHALPLPRTDTGQAVG